MQAQLSDYYNYQYRGAQDTHYSFRLRGSTGQLTGYIHKGDFHGQQLAAKLQSGPQIISVTVQRTGEQSSIVEILSFQ